MTRNLLNHTLKLERDISGIKEAVGEVRYKKLHNRALELLTRIELQGSYIRYSEELTSIQAYWNKVCVPSAREKIQGVDDTPLMDECLSLGLQICDFTSRKDFSWTKLKAVIQKQDKTEWINENPGIVPPEIIK